LEGERAGEQRQAEPARQQRRRRMFLEAQWGSVRALDDAHDGNSGSNQGGVSSGRNATLFWKRFMLFFWLCETLSRLFSIKRNMAVISSD
jgi:hypothetical protein